MIHFSSIAEMCDYGVSLIKQGKGDQLKLNIMPEEIDEVKEYMKTHHPDIPFMLDYPEFKEAQ